MIEKSVVLFDSKSICFGRSLACIGRLHRISCGAAVYVFRYAVGAAGQVVQIISLSGLNGYYPAVEVTCTGALYDRIIVNIIGTLAGRGGYGQLAGVAVDVKFANLSGQHIGFSGTYQNAVTFRGLQLLNRIFSTREICQSMFLAGFDSKCFRVL